MSEQQPLLDRILPLPAGAYRQDHPIFLRACHSPWQRLNQNVLCYVRGIILAYLIAVTGMTWDFKVNRPDRHSDWRFLFQFSAITWTLLLLYHIMVFCWTLTHLHWPEIEADDNTWESAVLRVMQPPEQPPPFAAPILFSVFYSLVHVYSFMLTIIYWAVLVPNGHGHLPHDPDDGDNTLRAVDHIGDLFRDGWFTPFCLFNIYTFPSLLAVIEIFFLNSIKRQMPVPSHIFAIQFHAALYLGWAALGKLFTGHSPFFWMDAATTGAREIVAAYCVGFVCLAAGCFSFMYGLIGMRESMVDQAAEADEPTEGAEHRH